MHKLEFLEDYVWQNVLRCDLSGNVLSMRHLEIPRGVRKKILLAYDQMEQCRSERKDEFWCVRKNEFEPTKSQLIYIQSGSNFIYFLIQDFSNFELQNITFPSTKGFETVEAWSLNATPNFALS